MMRFRTFEEMLVWQDARKLTALIYSSASEGLFARDFGLRDQIRRSAVSIMSNVSEGYERSSKREFAMFLGYAKGSAGELRSQLYVALDQKYITEDQVQTAYESVTQISAQLSKFSAYLRTIRGLKLTSVTLFLLLLSV
jgi:four helix bundle protein